MTINESPSECQSESALLTQVARCYRREAEAVFAAHGIRAGQEYLLAALWHRDGQRPSELARTLSVSAPTVTKMLARLVDAGFVTNRADPTDTRSSIVQLTVKGKRARSRIREEITLLEDRTLAVLSPDERSMLKTLLSRVAAHFAVS
jgi:MarR family transcriptional regulator, organic hydroperoxide resistance regulator